MLSKKGILIIFIELILVYLLIMGGVFGFDYLKAYLSNAAEKDVTLSVLANSPINNQKLTDNLALYNTADNLNIENLYITVYKGENPKAGNPFTLADLNTTDGRDETDNEPIVKVTVSQGLPEGLEGKLGYKATAPNGLMQIRGHSARNSVLKSYKIKLFDGVGSFYGQTVLNLNKHPNDETRILQKLCFDFFPKLKDTVSIRTKFVHLFVMDKSGDKPETTYKDYGLFTHTEQPSKDFLNVHNLDVNGNLYKALSFEFFRYKDEIKNIDDPTYSKDLFETRLNLFAGKDNRKLITMLDALNSNDVDINAVVDKYFDKDNYLTWMSINILLGNYDTTSQNYMLYSPLNSEKWYFIPWDYDGTMKNTKLFLNFFTYMPDSQKGLARYWGVNLHKRYFAYKENCEALTKKIEEVKKVFIDNDFSGVANKYNSLVWGIVTSTDDIKHISTDGIKNIKPFLNEFNTIIEKNYQLYLKSIHSPMPNFLLDSKKVNNKWQFRWTPSQDIDGDIVRYHFQLATDPYFKNIVEEKRKYFSTDYTLTKDLAKGHYFYRVVIDDGKGNIQLPYDTYDVSEEEQAFGLREFFVE